MFRYNFFVFLSVISYIVTVPLDSGDIVGIVYVWIGNSVHPDDALLAQEIANEMYNVRKVFFVIFSIIF